MGGGGHITIVNYLIVAESIKYQHNSNIGMQANRCCCSFQAKTSQQAQPPGVDICTVYWPCQAIFSASCYFKLASGVFCVTKFKRVDVDMFILIRSKKYASLLRHMFVQEFLDCQFPQGIRFQEITWKRLVQSE